MSDEMALDLEINGTSHRDGTVGDVALANSDAILVTKPLAPSSPSKDSPSKDSPPNGIAVNGASTDANFSIPPDSDPDPDTDTLEISLPPPLEPQIDEPLNALQIDEPLDPLPSSLPEENTTQDPLSPGPAPILKSEPEPDDPMDATPPAHPDIDMMDVPQPTSTTNSRHGEDDERSLERTDITENTSAESSTTHGPAAPSTLPSEAPETKPEPSTEIFDAPQLTSTKNSRDLEDDEDEERSVKRTKIAEDAPVAQSTTNGVAVASAPSSEAPKARPEPNQEPGRQITKYVEKELIKHLKNAARTTDGKHFKEPVAVLWPAFAESYKAKIDKPIDFSTIEQKLRTGRYASMNGLKEDLQLLRANALTFNGVDNPIAQSAVRATRAVLDKIDSIPPDPPSIARVVNNKKTKAATPVSDAASKAPVAAARRHSRGGGTVADTASAPAPTYALNPQSNTPLIRRDSTKDDGRPKRDIHPPKNKDLPYTTRPKSKKHNLELSWCQDVITEFNKQKYVDFVYPFKEPVDPVAHGIPTYFSVVKTPMDLSTVQTKLDSGHYMTAKDFEKDITQIYTNCYKFNPPGNPVNDCGKKLEALWKDQVSKKARWMSDHAPATAIASASPTPEYDEEASDDEQPQQQHQVAVTTNAGTAATKRLVEEQDKLIALMSTPNADPGQLEMQKQMISFLKTQVEKETVASAPIQNTKRPKKPKAPVPRAPAPAQQSHKKKAPATATAPVKKPSHSSHKSNHKKEKYMGTIEKEVISAGIATLPDAVSAQVLKLIQDGQPDIDEGDDGTVELDIDAIPTATLWKIYDLIKTHTPEVERDLRRQFQEREAPRATTKQAPKKKNKPMNKFEQDRKIEQLKNQMQTFERGNSNSQEPPLPSVEDHGNDSSGDEDSDSEEE